MLRFILPTEADREAVQAYYGEIALYGSESIGFANYENYDLWLRGMRNRHTGTDLPEGYVRENFYLCYDGKTLVGVFSLKFELTEFLRNFGGHIGYAVRPSLRRRGYATAMLAQGLALAREFGFPRVLCVCNEDNVASERVIVKNGGIFENRLFDPDEQLYVKRYWIALK